MSDRIVLGEVISEGIRLARSSWRVNILVFFGLFLTSLAIDLLLSLEDAIRAQGLLGLMNLYFQLVVVSAALSAGGVPGYSFKPREPTRGRYPSAFGLSLVWFLGVGGGLVLLVVPGLVLLVRWSVSTPVLLAEDLGILESLRRSWQITRIHWKVAALVLALDVAMFILVSLASLTYPAWGKIEVGPAIAVNSLFATWCVGMWLLASALYVLIRRRELDEEESQSRVEVPA